MKIDKKIILSAISLLTLWTSIFVPLIPTVLAVSPKKSTMKNMGVIGPFFESNNSNISYTFSLRGFAEKRVGRYVKLSFEGVDGRISIPGYPALPYGVHVVKLPLNAVVDEVGISRFDYEYERLSERILPAPNPLFYMENVNQTLKYKENVAVYADNAFFPGRLMSFYVTQNFNKETTVNIQLYPIQYNPTSSELLVFRTLEVSIKYHIESSYSSSLEKNVIITTSSLNASVWPLAEYYNTTIGTPTQIVTTDWIYAHYPSAKNITAYSGFYAPFQQDVLYEDLKSYYNWTLALRIISYLNQTLPSHVLLVGSAKTVPPSFYYQSETMSRMDPWWGWIPTDYFYASTDYDLLPERSVGRIPFDNKTLVEKTVNKIISWLNATWQTPPDWMRTLTMAGGYPFGLTFMLGESALAETTIKGSTQMFNTTLLTRTDYTYNRTTIQNALENGHAGWLFILCHGNGVSLGDYIFRNNWPELEILADTGDLSSYPVNNALPVVTSVACENGVWDESLLTPEFSPPSFGEALLTSNAGGIAYIGSARPAFELGIFFSLEEGMLKTEFYGATLLHTMLIKAYNSFMGTRTNVSLGEVYAKGLQNFVLNAIPLIGDQYLDLAYANVFMLNLMGDPGLKLPVYDKPFGENITDVNALEPYSMLNASAMFGAYGIANGTIPFYKVPTNATIQTIGNSTAVKINVIKTFCYGPYLTGHRAITTVEGPFVGNEANVTISTNKDSSGLLLLRVKVKCVEARFYIASAGLEVQPNEAQPGSMINVEAYGLGILSASSVYLTIGGWLITYLSVPYEGNVEWNFTLPFFNPGEYKVEVCYTSTPMMYPPNSELEELLTASIMILPSVEPHLDIVISCGGQYEPDENVNVMIQTLFNGKLIDSNLTVNLTKPNGVVPLTYQRISEGTYFLNFSAPTNPGTYFITVKAEVYHTLPAFNLTGCNSRAFTVTISFETLRNRINEGQLKIETMLTEINATIASVTSKGVIEIQTTLGTLNASILSVQNDTLTIISTLGQLNITLGEVKELMNDAKGDVIAAVDTAYGLVNLTLSQLKGNITAVSDNTVEIKTVLGSISGEILAETKDGVVTIKTQIGEILVGVNEIREQTPVNANYSIATLAATIIASLIIVVIVLLNSKKHKTS